jgi:hypothetical protein
MITSQLSIMLLMAIILLLIIILSFYPILNKVSAFDYTIIENNNTYTGSYFSPSDSQNNIPMTTSLASPKNLIASAIDQIRNSTLSLKDNNLNNNTNVSIVRDSTTVLLGMKVIPPKDFIPLYDSTPYKIINGHVIAKLPCDTRSQSQLKILVGHIPNLKPVQLELVKELSSPGYVCIYQLDLPPKPLKLLSEVSSSSGLQTNNNTDITSNVVLVTDLAVQNPSNNPIRLPYTTTIVIGVNEIMRISQMSSQ